MAIDDHLLWISEVTQSLRDSKGKDDGYIYKILKQAREDWSTLERKGKEDVFIYLLGRIVTLSENSEAS